MIDLGQLLKKAQSRIARGILELMWRKNTHYDINGYDRIYFIHIRKTGGTSLNHMFLSLGDNDPGKLYEELSRKPDHRIVRREKIFVGWNKKYINEGKYYYAFSHNPIYNLELPMNTFTVTIFRDPVKRVLSHYKMLLEYHENNIYRSDFEKEAEWLGDSFEDFVDRIPKEHLMNQLWMFSKSFNVSEAYERVQKVSHCFFAADFEKGITRLNEKLGLELKSLHIRKTSIQANVTNNALELLREMLTDEYRFLGLLHNRSCNI